MTNSNQNYENCNEAMEDFASLLESGNISDTQIVELKMKFPDCIETIQEQYTLWQDLADIDVPETSNQMHSKFYNTLAEFDKREGNKDAEAISTSKDNIMNLRSNPWKWAIAASILAIGILIGRGFSDGQSPEKLIAEDGNSPSTFLSYASQSKRYSATEKLIAIQEIKEEAHPSEKIIDALYQVLLNDPSINVRLTAIETLLHFADQPKAREYLLRAIPYQESALVQVALADAMLILQESKSVDAWNEILNSPNVEPDVKIHIAETLETLL